MFVYITSDNDDPYRDDRYAMIERQLIARDITDSSVIHAMSVVPRHQFVPENNRQYSYHDRPIPIGYEQTISQPYIVAIMTQLLELKGTEKVLEIGTGSGYQTAVLAEIAHSVYTIEIIPALFARAKQTFAQLNYTSIHLKNGDGYHGWQEYAPFDCIILTAAAPKIPQPLIDQLALNGRLVMPRGTHNKNQRLMLYIKTNHRLMEKECLPVSFVPMTGCIDSD